VWLSTLQQKPEITQNTLLRFYGYSAMILKIHPLAGGGDAMSLSKKFPKVLTVVSSKSRELYTQSSSANKLFILQKKTVTIITDSGVRQPCREAFKNMQIMTLYSQYIFSLILFTVKNKHLFAPNNEIQKYKTRNNTNLHLPTVNITKFYKGPYILGSKAFNHLPRHIKILANDMKSFKSSKRFLYHNSFYSIEEYYKYDDDKDT
jgi:hypothetical protein